MAVFLHYTTGEKRREERDFCETRKKTVFDADGGVRPARLAGSSMNFFIDNGSNIGNGKFNELRFNIAEKLPLCMIKLLGLKNKLNIYTGWKNIE